MDVLIYGGLVPDTAAHKSSMLQDITAGRRTEIDALTGAVIHLAQGHGIAVPYNLALYNLVRFLETARHESTESKNHFTSEDIQDKYE